MLQKIGGKLVVAGNVPNTGNELEKSFSSANFQALGPKPAPVQSPTSSIPYSGTTGTTAKS